MTRFVTLLFTISWVMVFVTPTVLFIAGGPVPVLSSTLAWLGLAILFALPLKRLVDRVPDVDALEALKALGGMISSNITSGRDTHRRRDNRRQRGGHNHVHGHGGLPLDSDTDFEEMGEG